MQFRLVGKHRVILRRQELGRFPDLGAEVVRRLVRLLDFFQVPSRHELLEGVGRLRRLAPWGEQRSDEREADRQLGACRSPGTGSRLSPRRRRRVDALGELLCLRGRLGGAERTEHASPHSACGLCLSEALLEPDGCAGRLRARVRKRTQVDPRDAMEHVNGVVGIEPCSRWQCPCHLQYELRAVLQGLPQRRHDVRGEVEPPARVCKLDAAALLLLFALRLLHEGPLLEEEGPRLGRLIVRVKFSKRFGGRRGDPEPKPEGQLRPCQRSACLQAIGHRPVRGNLHRDDAAPLRLLLREKRCWHRFPGIVALGLLQEPGAHGNRGGIESLHSLWRRKQL
mmetsp:Transcript_12836/g.30444  ORF Transcript_12836/g.30444 Transcript_12836/m.30444 type:complete len:339 (-) Transcript_12836:652-1668(-)